VGLGVLFPDAKNINQFWKNIINKKVSIREMPEEIFESEIYYRPDLLTSFNKQEKSYTRVAAWIEGMQYDTVRKYKIPPSMAERMDENQHAALYSTDQALQSNPLQNVSKDRVGVIFGNGMVGTAYGDALVRVQFQLIEHYLRRHPIFTRFPEKEQNEIIEYVRTNVLKGSVPINEDNAPGMLPNIIAGRIANVYDFHGPSFTVDAACASVLAAIITGIQGLYLNEYDAVICGGSDMPMKQLGFIYFSAINALSPDGSYPFDKRANGFVMGQGAGTVILRRLEDAIKDKDTIYAVITGFGQASDGKGKYIAAPNEAWQARTIEKACKMASYSVDTIEMVEAHGTATIVGDEVEVNALKKAFSTLGATRKNYCGLTSVKSNIGHLKSAAGIAGFIKAALAIHHKMLPPSANFKEINPKLQIEDSPFYVIDEAKEWESKIDHPRRANVSAFGFGGADYHVALEEYRKEDYRNALGIGFDASKTQIVASASPQMTAKSESDEIIFFAGKSLDEIDGQVKSFQSQIKSHQNLSFSDHSFLHNYNIQSNQKSRLAIIASSIEDFQSKYEFFIKNKEKLDDIILSTKGIFFKEKAAIKPSEIAVIFPGQASQYLNMFRNVYDQYDSFHTLISKADAFWFSKHGYTVSSLIFPVNKKEEEALETLRQTQNAHSCIFITSFALYELLKNMGFQAKYMTGHSLGEITALAAAEKLSVDDALRLVEMRGFAFHNTKFEDMGKMISIMGTLEQANELIQESGIDVSVANINSRQQIIIAGSSPYIEQFKIFLNKEKVSNKILFVSHAFHSPVIQPVAEIFYRQIKDIRFKRSAIKVIMNHVGNYYPNTVKSLEKIPELLKDQILQPVNFVKSIEKLYMDGVRLFVEVGPGSILSTQVKNILRDKEVTILTSNFKNADDIMSLTRLYGALFVEGIPIKLLPKRQSVSQQPVIMVQEQRPEKIETPVQEIVVPQQPFTSLDRKETVVFSGVSIGLPGSYKEVFRDDNFQQIFEGRNFIERITDDERQKFVDLKITKLIKDDSGPSFKFLASLEDVIQLAGKIGKLDMIRDYQIDDMDLQNMTTCISMGVAAGYEALKDAHIPLIREYATTASGKTIPQKLSLPKYMQEETGVIFANGFPLIDPVIREVSRYLSYQLGSKTRKDLMEFYENLISRVKDHDTRKLLTDWYTLYYSRLTDNLGSEDVYQFNYNFMDQISAQTNNRLASLINAKGPNFQMNAACSSTSNAITIAEDFIRSGRAKRMIVVGADDPTSKINFPMLGAGFLCTGAATNECDLYKASVPFDVCRNGMIISAGAVGVVLEAKGEIEKRGVKEIAQLLGTHSFNTAQHPSQIDCDQFAHEMDKFISRMEREYGLNRNNMAKQMIYISHETYTPSRGGCSQTEAEALRGTFGTSSVDIIVGNTKGMTGHCMGAALEDAVAAKALQYGKVPPIVNLKEPDPMLEGLNLSRGGSHNRNYALRMSAGFGSQGHFSILKKSAVGDQRIIGQKKYKDWLKTISKDDEATTEQLGRIFAITDRRMKKQSASEKTVADQTIPVSEPKPEIKPTALVREIAASNVVIDKNTLANEVINLISGVTNYPPEMLEYDMEIEADLGINKQNQTIIESELSEKFGVEIQLSNFDNIGKLIGFVYNEISFEQKIEAKDETIHTATVETNKIDKEIIKTETLQVFSEVTQYPEDMLELDMEMEADLGIDTVKQATILAILGEKYMLEREEGMQLSNYPTIGHIVDLIYEKAGTAEIQPEEPMVVDVKPEMTHEVKSLEFISVEESNLTRQVVVLLEEKLGKKNYDLRNKSVWLLGENKTEMKKIAAALKEKKANVRLFIFPDGAVQKDIENAVSKFIAGKSADVIIDSSHIGTAVNFRQLAPDQAQQILFMNSVARFIFYKNLSAKINYPAKIICLTSIDGRIGYHDEISNVTDPSFGALIGFYKALRKEWTDLDVKIIDFSPKTMSDDFDACMTNMISEIEHSGLGVEIAYSNGKRMVVKIDEKEIQSHQELTFSNKDTFLMTGGGTGITARISLALAEKYPVNFIIVGTVKLPDNIESLARLDDTDLEKVRQEIHERLKQNYEKVTPVMINKQFDAIIKSIEIHQNIEKMKNLGRKIEYIACDVRDLDRLKDALYKAESSVGQVTAIVHGAGIDKSHLLDQKSIEEFQNVFSVKANGAYNLMHLCRNNPLKLVVAFSSISGRFGNAAQLDYSAANSFLNYWIKMMAHTMKDINAISLIWSGWKDVGIAWRNEFVRQKSEEMGLNFIDVNEGINAFMQEIENRTSDQEVILHKGLNGFVEEGLAVTGLHDYPLIDRVIKKDKEIVRAYRMFSVKRDALIDQHRLGKTPILPAVAYSELAVEYYALQMGQKQHYAIRDLTFSNAFKLFHKQPRELFIEGKRGDSDGVWDIEIKSNFRPLKSDTVQTILHSRATVSEKLSDYRDLNPNLWDFDETKKAKLSSEESLLLMQNSGPEQRIILGALYNDVVRESKSKAPVSIYPNNTIYPTYFPKEQLTNEKYPLDLLLINPCFLDSIYQACAAHLLVNKKRVYLPWEVKELGIVSVPKKPGLFMSYTKVVEESDDLVAFDVVMVDSNGEICYYAKKCYFHRINL
jgi:acyl transferase domain-containing protein/NAD(P)-dependent dehydrogenase (short-subunit alcohol dehydrogenase family)